MTEIYEGELNGDGVQAGIVVARFNDMITDKLLEGATDRFIRLGAREQDIDVSWVPGAFELPRAVQQFVQSGDYDGVVALGAVVRGETPHFEYVASEASKGLAQLNLNLPVPVTFGLITADTMDQALDRAGGKQGNKGAEAAESLVEMINLERSF